MHRELQTTAFVTMLLKGNLFICCQELKQPEEMAAVLEVIQQYQKEMQQHQQQQPTDYDVNRQDSGNPPAPDSYSNPPIPMTLPTKFFRSQEAATREENKRASRKYIKNLSHFHSIIFTDHKGKGLPQHAEVAQGVPGGLRPRIFLTFGTTRVVGRQPYAPAAFTLREIPGTHF